MPDVKVKKASGKISVSDPDVHVSVRNGDKVTWNSDDGHFRNPREHPGGGYYDN